MTEQSQIYKCEICGNIIEVLHKGADALVCCGKPMKLMPEQFEGEYAEKHSPVIEKDKEGVKIKVGSIEHPMETEHYIEWIEISTDKGVSKKFLKPSEKPEALFLLKNQKDFSARAYCNIHGLWKNQ